MAQSVFIRIQPAFTNTSQETTRQHAAMPLPSLLQSHSGEQTPRKRKNFAGSSALATLDRHRAVTALILAVTVVAIVLISFIGIDSSMSPVFPNQVSNVRVVAEVPFDYISQQRADDEREEIRNRTPRVYKLDTAPLAKFEIASSELLANLEIFEKQHPAPTPAAGGAAPAENAAESAAREAAFHDIVRTFNARGPYNATDGEILALYGFGDDKARQSLVSATLTALGEIYQDGIQDATFAADSTQGTATISKIVRPDGRIIERPTRTLDYARTELRINLAADNIALAAIHDIAGFFDNALAPNLIFDQAGTERLADDTISKLPPPVVHVERDQTIIANGARVTPARYEMFQAYRAWLLNHGDTSGVKNLLLLRRLLLVLAMVLACAFYIRIEDRETLESNGRLALLALVVILNLALVRLTYWLGALPYFISHPAAASMLPYFAPAAIAPIIVAILIDTGSAIFMALLISLFTSVIYGSRLDVLVCTFCASVIAIHQSRHVRNRANIMRAALLAGAAVAVFAFLFGIIDKQSFWLPEFTVPRQMGAALASGLATGVIVVGILPIIETLFKRTTDITLLELTDYNHPLMRRMQMEAPGSYHHSLVVAQLSENAASAIGANPLLARVCALFHDIGKINKPEYFTENQHDRANPHDENNPSLSALIIKSHVKDGVDLARKYHLPRAVIDAIQQHHGTSLIRYFYQRALSERRAQTSGAALHDNNADPGLEPPEVSQATYRYDGPLPQFKESVIIHLADSVEAASRSLREITAQNLSELIDQIVKERIDDGQLAEAPITFEELSKIKSSFTLTLLNMNHTRIAYPPAKEKPGENPARATQANSEP